MMIKVFYLWQYKSFSEVCKFIEEELLERFRFHKKCNQINQITVFLESPEVEDAFVAEYLCSRRYGVVGIAEERTLLEPFYKRPENCRGIWVEGEGGAEQAIILAVSMDPDLCPSEEGVWDGTVLLRRPTVTTLAIASACAANSGMLVLVTTLIDPSRHLMVAVNAPQIW